MGLERGLVSESHSVRHAAVDGFGFEVHINF